MREATVDPQRREFFLDGILAEALVEGVEIHAVEGLVLVEAGEDHRFLAGRRVAVGLEALGADLLHHALHRRVDGADGAVIRL